MTQNFFSKISTNFSNGVLKIKVEENPIIYSITIKGEDTKKYTKAILKGISLKEKSSYVESSVKRDVEVIKHFYKSLGYYSVEVEAKKQTLDQDNKRINLVFDVNKGKRNKITKIYFTGEKKVRSKRLRDVVASEESKVWKFLSKNIYLNEDRIELDKRLLKNYYLSQGYYDVQVLSSSADIEDKDSIELTFTINAGKRYRIKKLETNIDPVFEKSIFQSLQEEFEKFAGEYYSPFKVKRILSKIDRIIELNELQFVQHSVSETVGKDGIDITFNVFEGRKVQIERINILGNTVTNDSVIRSELLLDEGDPYSSVKVQKSISNLKARGIFREVKHKISDGSSKDLKVMDIEVEEQPTGEISAGAGVGTEGTSFMFALKENNYLGKGLKVTTAIDLTEHAIRGGVELTDPNYKYTGNAVYGGISTKSTDRPDSGYENTVTNINIGTKFEQYADIYFNPSLDLTFDDLRVDDTASSSLKKQAGDFTDLQLGYGVQKDARDRRYMPTSGSIVSFTQKIPVIADQSSLYNAVSYSKYHLFTDDIIGSVKFYGAAITGLNNDDVRLSKRLHIPSRRLRGFENRKVGPKDGTDYVGGNYVSAINFEAALPNLLPEDSQTDVAVFVDIGNIWHVDYDATLDDSNKIRSALGLSTNVHTPIGPLSFVLAQDLSKADTDTTQTFKFQIGTSF